MILSVRQTLHKHDLVVDLCNVHHAHKKYCAPEKNSLNGEPLTGAKYWESLQIQSTDESNTYMS